MVDTNTAEMIASYPAQENAFLNDVALSSEGHVYVSDSQKSLIYHLENTGLEVFFKDANLVSPNGLYVLENKLVIAASDMEALQPYTSRYVQILDLNEKTLSLFSDRTSMGSLDGVEPDGQGGFFLSDWGTGLMLHTSATAEVSLLALLEQGAADFDYVQEDNLLYLPMMFSDSLIAYQIGWE